MTDKIFVPLDGDLRALERRYSLSLVPSMLVLGDEYTWKNRYYPAIEQIACALASAWGTMPDPDDATPFHLRGGDCIVLNRTRHPHDSRRSDVMIRTYTAWPHVPPYPADVVLEGGLDPSAHSGEINMHRYTPAPLYIPPTLGRPGTAGRAAEQEYRTLELAGEIRAQLYRCKHTFPPKCCDAYCEPSVRGPMCLVCDKRWVLPKIVRRSPRD